MYYSYNSYGTFNCGTGGQETWDIYPLAKPEKDLRTQLIGWRLGRSESCYDDGGRKSPLSCLSMTYVFSKNWRIGSIWSMLVLPWPKQGKRARSRSMQFSEILAFSGQWPIRSCSPRLLNAN